MNFKILFKSEVFITSLDQKKENLVFIQRLVFRLNLFFFKFFVLFCIYFCSHFSEELNVNNHLFIGRRRRRRHHNSDSEEDDADELESQSPPERDADWGKVVCVDYGDKRGSKKDIWFPAVIVAPTAQDPTTKMSKDEYLVRSFRDGRFYKVNKKDAREFTKETVLSKSESNSSALRSAMEKAVSFMDKQELPNHWDFDLLMGNVIPQVWLSFTYIQSPYLLFGFSLFCLFDGKICFYRLFVYLLFTTESDRLLNQWIFLQIFVYNIILVLFAFKVCTKNAIIFEFNTCLESALSFRTI